MAVTFCATTQMSNIHRISDYNNNPNRGAQPGGGAPRQGNMYRQQNDGAPFPGALQPEERYLTLPYQLTLTHVSSSNSKHIRLSIDYD
jgi:hypothetical protein